MPFIVIWLQFFLQTGNRGEGPEIQLPRDKWLFPKPYR